MNHKFDHLAKGLAQSTTRRAALKKFGSGIAGITLATLGLANKAHADKGGKPLGSRCTHDAQCQSGKCCTDYITRNRYCGPPECGY